MLCILKQTHTFEHLAQALHPLGWDLVDVRSCTFPSRPEPARAAWKVNGDLVMRYHYEPDLELRAIQVHTPWPDVIDATPRDVCDSLHLFEPWESLACDLGAGVRGKMIRACAAWRWRALVHPDARQREDALEQLIHALETCNEVQLQRQASLELQRCATPVARAALERASEHADLEVRLHARGALRALDERAFLSRGR